MVWRLFLAVWFAVGLSIDIYVVARDERKTGGNKKESPRYRPYLASYLLPMYIGILLLMLLPQKRYETLLDMLYRFLGIFLHIGVYYAVLMIAIPYLRRYFSSRVCAVLWIIPNYLYVFAILPLHLGKPWMVISLPDISGTLLAGIWLAGFAVVLGWKGIAHLRFRKWLLESSEPVTDATMLRLWGEAQVNARLVKPDAQSHRFIPMMQSERINTPLAVGLMRLTTVMVMPKRSYSEEELTMIFQHEVIHIGREDSWTKFFLVFCTAMCWFNPLMWIAVRRCSEDVELSCDETVLLDAEDAKKKQYAQLLLKTTGDDRGFTTCLSATGRAMRYRLGQVMDAPKRKLGLVVIMFAAILLFASYGIFPLSYYCGTATDVIFQGTESEKLKFVHIRMDQSEPVSALEAEATLYKYLSQIQARRLSGSYGEEKSRHKLSIQYDNPGYFFVLLYDQRMEVFRYQVGVTEEYYLSEPVDWDYVQTLLSQ